MRRYQGALTLPRAAGDEPLFDPRAHDDDGAPRGASYWRATLQASMHGDPPPSTLTLPAFSTLTLVLILARHEPQNLTARHPAHYGTRRGLRLVLPAVGADRLRPISSGGAETTSAETSTAMEAEAATRSPCAGGPLGAAAAPSGEATRLFGGGHSGAKSPSPPTSRAMSSPSCDGWLADFKAATLPLPCTAPSGERTNCWDVASALNLHVVGEASLAGAAQACTPPMPPTPPRPCRRPCHACRRPCRPCRPPCRRPCRRPASSCRRPHAATQVLRNVEAHARLFADDVAGANGRSRKTIWLTEVTVASAEIGEIVPFVAALMDEVEGLRNRGALQPRRRSHTPAPGAALPHLCPGCSRMRRLVPPRAAWSHVLLTRALAPTHTHAAWSRALLVRRGGGVEARPLHQPRRQPAQPTRAAHAAQARVVGVVPLRRIRRADASRRRLLRALPSWPVGPTAAAVVAAAAASVGLVTGIGGPGAAPTDSPRLLRLDAARRWRRRWWRWRRAAAAVRRRDGTFLPVPPLRRDRRADGQDGGLVQLPQPFT